MSIFLLFLYLYNFNGRVIAEKIAGSLIDANKYALSEEVPLYTPNLVRFATLYIYTSQNDTFSVITGDSMFSRPVYEFGHGTYRFRMYSRKYGGYKGKRVIYVGYSTFFVKSGDLYYDVRFFKPISEDEVKRIFNSNIKFKNYRGKWERYMENDFKLDEYAEIDSVPAFLWSYGCSPTSSAMILGYWDKRGYGKLIDFYFDHFDVVLNEEVQNVPNVQKELAIYMSTDTTTGETSWFTIHTGTQNCANDDENGYSFVSDWVYGTNSEYYRAFMYLKQEIDSGRPVHWAVGNYLDPYGRIIDHSTCAFGYEVSGSDTFVILHNTWDKGTWAWPLYTTDSTYLAVYNVIPGGMVQGNLNSIVVPTQIVNNLYFPVKLEYDSMQNIDHCELYIQNENQEMWTYQGNIPKDTIVYVKKDFSPVYKTRFMVKTFDASGNLTSAESSVIPSGIIYPVFSDSMFHSLAFCTVDRQPFVVNLIDSLILVGTNHGIEELSDGDSIIYKYNTLGDTVFTSSQYGDYIIYGKNSEGFCIYLQDSLIYRDTTSNYVQDVDINDSVACVFERNSGMRVMYYKRGFYQDTIPSNGLFFMTGVISNNYAYIGTLTQGVLVLDIISGQIVDTLGSGRVWDIAVSRESGILYVLYNSYVKEYNIKDQCNPSLIDSIFVGSAVHIRCNNNRFFVINGDEGVDIYTISFKGYLKSSISGIGTVKDVYAKDSVFYVLNGEGLVYKVSYYGSSVKEDRIDVKIRNCILTRGVLSVGKTFNNKEVFVYSPDGRLLLKEVVKDGMVNLKSLKGKTFILRIGKRRIKVIKLD